MSGGRLMPYKDIRKKRECARRYQRRWIAVNRTPERIVWEQMIQRCSDRNIPAWKNYGGRGITVCARWRSFKNFLADMGPRPVGRSLDRIDNNGNYEPGNCRWATQKEQTRNCRTNRLLTFQGRTLPMSQWTEIMGFKPNLIWQRLGRGWSVEKSLTTPVGGRHV